MLHHLERGTEDGAAEVGAGVEDRSGEAGSPRGEPRTGGDGGSLDLGVGDNLGKLDFDELRVSGLSTKTDEDVASILELALLDEVTGRIGEEEETGGKDGSPGELDTDGDAVSARVGSVLGKVADDRGEHDTWKQEKRQFVSIDSAVMNETDRS